MKKILFALSFLSVWTINGQVQGEIKYATKINMHAELPDNENSEMIKKMIPEFQTMKNVLLFTETESLYKSANAEEEIIEEGNTNIRIEMNSDESQVYTNLETGIITQQTDLMGKMFLIKDTLRQSEWKILDEQKSFAGLLCQKATLTTDQDTVNAWFTAQVPISAGPSGFTGLPGLIVHVSMNHGNFQITATDIDKRVIGKKEIKEPTKGKAISQEDFNALQMKKMKEMEEQFGGGNGSTSIIIR